MQFGNFDDSECCVFDAKRSAGIRAICLLNCLSMVAEISAHVNGNSAGFAAFSSLLTTVIAVGVQAIIMQAMVVQSPS